MSAAATRALARPGSRTVAVLGSGVQGRSHVDAMQTVLDDPIIRIWSRTQSHAEALALETHSLVAATVEEAVDGADVVSPRRRLQGAHRRARLAGAGERTSTPPGGGADGKSRELAGGIVASARLYVDRRESARNKSGDVRLALHEHGLGEDHIVGELGELLAGDGSRAAPSDDELTVFKSMGIAVEDLASAQLCVSRARERGVGVGVEF